MNIQTFREHLRAFLRISAKTALAKGPHVSLTENQLKALKPKDKPYKVSDERGLFVEVTPTGSKLWRYRYRIGKIEKKLSIGTYPDISLKQARHVALEARMPARTTPSSGVTLAPLGADLPASGLSGLSQRDGPLDD